MKETRTLEPYEARWVARTVAKAVWARMSGHSLDVTDFAWRDTPALLDEAFDAVVKHLPERVPAGKVVVDGDCPTAGPYPTAHAWCDAFNALQGMPRDASAKRTGGAQGRATASCPAEE